jgi:tRNA 2-thiouridine synthesizing protein A
MHRARQALETPHGQWQLSAMAESEIDLSGLKCPLPALKTRKALSRLAPGDRLSVIATDPLASIDIPNLVRETGDVLIDSGQSGDRLNFVIEKI